MCGWKRSETVRASHPIKFSGPSLVSYCSKSREKYEKEWRSRAGESRDCTQVIPAHYLCWKCGPTKLGFAIEYTIDHDQTEFIFPTYIHTGRYKQTTCLPASISASTASMQSWQSESTKEKIFQVFKSISKILARISKVFTKYFVFF